MRWFVYLTLVAVPAGAQQTNPFNPGSTESPPGTGCQIGTSGCFPSSPPGPVAPRTDKGAVSENPPPIVDPHDVPFYGQLPGPTEKSDQPVATPEAQAQIQAAEAQRQREAAAQEKEEARIRQEERDQRVEQLLDQQQQILEQQQQLLEQQQPEPSPAP